MKYKKSELLEIAAKHIQDLRKTLPVQPSEEMLAVWRLEDARREIMRDYYSQEEEEDDGFTFGFTSEVRSK